MPDSPLRRGWANGSCMYLLLTCGVDNRSKLVESLDQTLIDSLTFLYCLYAGELVC